MKKTRMQLNTAHWFLFLEFLFFYTVQSNELEMELEYNGQTQGKCNKGLLANVHSVNFTGQIDVTGITNVYMKVTMQRKYDRHFEHFCALKLPDDCDSLPWHKCSCVTVITSGIYTLSTNILAETSLSNALIRWELQSDSKEAVSSIKILPQVYDNIIDDVFLLFNGIHVNTSDCIITITQPFVSLLYGCVSDSPSPCRLSILDAETNETLQSGDGAILYENKVTRNITLTFTYTICELPNVSSFACNIQKDFSEGEKESYQNVCTETAIVMGMTLSVTVTVTVTVIVMCFLFSLRAEIKMYGKYCIKCFIHVLHPKRSFSKIEDEQTYTALEDLDINHLPEDIRDPHLFEYIKTVGKLTVKLDEKLASQKSLPLMSKGDKGVGIIQSVLMQPDNSKSSKSSTAQSAQIKVCTSQCVVSNKNEAIGTTCSFFHSSSSDKESTVYELVVHNINQEKDTCILTCHLDDACLLVNLKSLLYDVNALSMHLNSKNKNRKTQGKTAIKILYSDSGKKSVLIEKFKEEENKRNETNSCVSEGNCGAPVIVVGGPKQWCFIVKPAHIEKPMNTAEEKSSAVNILCDI